MSHDEAQRPRIRRRRIVERPRLLRALDVSAAQVRVLVAGPGYGKTTLLEQWSERGGARCGWVRARRSAADVAVTARSVAAATATLVEGAGRRMLERLAVTEDPEREAVLLAEMLAADLGGWPDDVCLVIDDYHHLAGSAAEVFVETLVLRSPVRLVIASRVRPSWVTGRAILYGDILEISQTALAFTEDEAAEVLADGRIDLVSGLLALAHGWPAVIGIAGMAPEAPEVEAVVPETLYAFFAEELYRGLDPEVASALVVLAAVPVVDRALAARLLGEDRARRVCARALALGIIDERDGRLDLHPLAAGFLAERELAGHRVEVEEGAATALAYYRERREWDAAFDLIRARGTLDGEFDGLVVAALDDTIFAGRIQTLEEWLAYARARGLSSPGLRLVEAESHLRRGRHLSALTLARADTLGTPTDRATTFRMLLAGARAAHIGSDEEQALDLYGRALDLSVGDGERRDARLGQLMCLGVCPREVVDAL